MLAESKSMFPFLGLLKYKADLDMHDGMKCNALVLATKKF